MLTISNRILIFHGQPKTCQSRKNAPLTLKRVHHNYLIFFQGKHRPTFYCKAGKIDPEFDQDDDEQSYIDVGSQVGDSIFEENQYRSSQSNNSDGRAFVGEDQEQDVAEFWEHVEPSLFGDEINRHVVAPNNDNNIAKRPSPHDVTNYAFPPTFNGKVDKFDDFQDQDIVEEYDDQQESDYQDQDIDEYDEEQMFPFEDIQVDYSSREKGFEFKEQFSSLDETTVPVASSDMDWREFRARLIKQNQTPTKDFQSAEQNGSMQEQTNMWAHMIRVPEQGCVLLANPSLFRDSQQYFRFAVILILEHSNEGTIGIILNRPTMYLFGDLDQQLRGMETLLPEFRDNRLMWGGDCGAEQGAMFLIHPYGELAGSEEIVRGVYAGGMKKAKELVGSGDLPPDKFKFFTKYCGWGPGQLEQELRRNVWLCVSASPEILLSNCGINGASMWHKYLQLIGGNAAEVSREFLEKEQFEEEQSHLDEFDVFGSQPSFIDNMDLVGNAFADFTKDSQSMQDENSQQDVDDPKKEDSEDFDKE